MSNSDGPNLLTLILSLGATPWAGDNTNLLSNSNISGVIRVSGARNLYAIRFLMISRLTDDIKTLHLWFSSYQC